MINCPIDPQSLAVAEEATEEGDEEEENEGTADSGDDILYYDENEVLPEIETQENSLISSLSSASANEEVDEFTDISLLKL